MQILAHGAPRVKTRTTPIYVGQRIVGQVDGDIFRKTIIGSKHLLQRPRSICFDRSTLNDAQAAGATRAEILDRETGTIYTATFETVETYSFPVHRGHGDQVGVTLDHWSINGAQPVAERQAAIQAAKHESVQPALFDMDVERRGAY